MANLTLKEATSLEAIDNLLQSRLPGRLGAVIENGRLRLVENRAKGCVVSLRSKNGENTCSVVGIVPSLALRAGLLVTIVVTLSLITSLVLGEFRILVGGAIPLGIAYVAMSLMPRGLVAEVTAVIESEFAESSRTTPRFTRWWPIGVTGLVVVLAALAVLWRPAPQPPAAATPDNATAKEVAPPSSALPHPADRVLPNEYSVVAQVSGNIDYLNPELVPGQVIAGGAVLVRVDGEDLELSLERAEAELQILNSELETLDAEESVVAKAVGLRQRQLAEIADERHQQPVAREIEHLQRELESIARRRQLSASGIAAIGEEIARLQVGLERTVVSLPVDIRIDAVLIGQDEFVSAGSVLFRATEVDSDANDR